MKEITGCQGELIGRLIGLLDNEVFEPGERYSLAMLVEMLLGGRMRAGVVADGGEKPAPGTEGARLCTITGGVVSCGEYFGLIRQRLGVLVESGVSEALIVRAIRDELGRMIVILADTRQGDRQRAEFRAFLEKRAGSAAGIAAYRAEMAGRDPLIETMSDDQIALRLRSDAACLQPTAAEEAARRQEVVRHWDQQSASLLPDSAIEAWMSRRRRDSEHTGRRPSGPGRLGQLGTARVRKDRPWPGRDSGTP